MNNKLAYNAIADATDVQVHNRLLEYFAQIKSEDLLSLWQKTVEECKTYALCNDQGLAIVDSDSSDDEAYQE